MTKNFDENEKNEETVEKKAKIEKDPLKEFRETLNEKDNEISKLKKELAELKKNATNYLNTASYYKAQAEAHKKDFDRYKERNKNIETEANLRANAVAAKKLVPIIDNFNSAMAVLPPDVMRGFIMIYTSLMDTIKELGVVEINPKNEAFNPEKHDCIEAIDTEEKELDNVVAKVYKKGYLLSETNEVIRPASVSVYKYTGM